MPPAAADEAGRSILKNFMHGQHELRFTLTCGGRDQFTKLPWRPQLGCMLDALVVHTVGPDSNAARKIPSCGFGKTFARCRCGHSKASRTMIRIHTAPTRFSSGQQSGIARSHLFFLKHAATSQLSTFVALLLAIHVRIKHRRLGHAFSDMSVLWHVG